MSNPEFMSIDSADVDISTMKQGVYGLLHDLVADVSVADIYHEDVHISISPKIFEPSAKKQNFVMELGYTEN